MKFCKYCGQPVSETDSFCTHCGKNLSPQPETAEEKGKPLDKLKATLKTLLSHKYAKPAVAVVVAIGLVLLILPMFRRCSVCGNKAVSGSEYCYSHKCVLSSCTNGRFGTSNYCYTHYKLYDEDAQKSKVSSSQLKISGITITSNSSYTIAQGTIKNNSSSTVKFVTIKGAFKDRSGSTVDTDWTYAVGSEGLAPGESCKWRMSVEKDTSIKSCTVTITDFDT